MTPIFDEIEKTKDRLYNKFILDWNFKMSYHKCIFEKLYFLIGCF